MTLNFFFFTQHNIANPFILLVGFNREKFCSNKQVVERRRFRFDATKRFSVGQRENAFPDDDAIMVECRNRAMNAGKLLIKAFLMEAFGEKSFVGYGAE